MSLVKSFPAVPVTSTPYVLGSQVPEMQQRDPRPHSGPGQGDRLNLAADLRRNPAGANALAAMAKVRENAETEQASANSTDAPLQEAEVKEISAEWLARNPVPDLPGTHELRQVE